MQVVEWYFAFYKPTTASIWQIFGHVSIFGYTDRDTWVFYDPERRKPNFVVTYNKGQIEDEIARQFALADEIIRMKPVTREYRLPPLMPITCASLCASMAGLRAFSVWGLRRKVLANNGEVRSHGRPKGRPRRNETA